MENKIKIKKVKKIDKQQLVDLFKSVEWDSANYPDKLHKSIKNSDYVLTAWDEKKLIGLINCISDDSMVAYIHYFLVHPSYQKKGVGSNIFNKMLNKYSNCHNIILISMNDAVEFYKRVGFKVQTDKAAMFLTKEN